MFELRNSGENRRKISEIFFENLPRAYKDLILVKKNSKISHACVPLTFEEKKFQIPCNKKLVLGILNHRKNVRTSKFWQKSKERIN